MVLNQEKRPSLAEVLTLREEAAIGAGAPALSAPNVALAAPSPAPSAPLDVVPLAAVGASHSPAPLEKGKRVVEIVFDDDADTMDDPVFKRRRVAVAATSHSSSDRRPASLKDHPSSALSPQSLFALEGGGESVSEPASAPKLPLIL